MMSNISQADVIRPLPQLIHPKYGDGFIAKRPEEIQAAESAGYQKCHGSNCSMMINPETQQRIAQGPGFYTCQNHACKQSFALHNEWPEYNPSDKSYAEMASEDEQLHKDLPYHITGGVRRSGFNVTEVGEIGENIIQHLGEIPGYGKITWWHQGGAASNSHLDGTTDDWGIEVKTIDLTSKNHRFIAGSVRTANDGSILDEPTSKIEAAAEEGKQGVLGLLVILNFYTSTADIYAKEFPIAKGKIGHFRTFEPNVRLIAKDVSFSNPNLDPHAPSPTAIKPIADAIPF